MSIIEVQAERPYRVQIASGAVNDLAEYFGEAQRICIVATSSVSAMAGRVEQIAQAAGRTVLKLLVPDGEAAKTLSVAADCWSQLAKAGFTRSDLIVGVGGGAVTDFAGFLAAAWLRGVDFITIPTTVLAMVDAAVGGKTGLNLPEGKNLVGAFHEPRAVLADLDALDSLPQRDICSGLAEIVKAGFIADQRILELIAADSSAARRPGPELAQLITWGIEFKAKVVSGDLRERTSTSGDIGRELLNYGHTLGHAVERHEDFNMRHGEAVSIGMVFAAELSHRLAGLSSAELQVHRDLLTELGLPTSYAAASFEQLRALMARDKKTRGDQLRFIGLSALQSPVLLAGPDEQALRNSYGSLGR